ncbi:hypothetical protein AWB78_07814 [Caballeronia calidae]|uniref:Uncharacterized protein n=1 Tax=Caballeronia calidae TaxID=1777139 RepID=A0A158EH04_9BURK|nr:hypothetical protein [Caballeronia calidae]SAL05990.1 hypothetical protein AWB78_07814 [Caballeronia calidae]
MGRGRLLKFEFFRNDALGHMPPHARLLFAGLITLADREGRLEDRPGRIKVDLFPYEPDLGEPEVDLWLSKFVESDLIARYTVDNMRVIQIVKWSKYQHPHPREAKSVWPANPDAVKEVNFRQAKKHTRQTLDTPSLSSPSLPSKDKPREKTNRSVSSLRSSSRAREANAETETTSATARKIFASKGLRLTATTATNLDAAIDAGVTADSIDHALDVAIARHAGSPGAYAVTTALDWLRNGTEPPRAEAYANGHGDGHGRRDELDSIAKDRKRIVDGLTGRTRRQQQASEQNVIDVPMQEVGDDTRHS